MVRRMLMVRLTDPDRHTAVALLTIWRAPGSKIGWLQLWLAEKRDKKFIRAARILLQGVLSSRSRLRQATW